MPDIYGIKSFIIRDVFPDTEMNSNPIQPPDELENPTFNVSETLTHFDFKDGNQNEGILWDNIVMEYEAPHDSTKGTRVVVDGVSHSVQAFREAAITLHFDDDHEVVHPKGAQLFFLGTSDREMLTGDILVNPINHLRLKIAGYIKDHPGVRLTSYTIGKIDNGYLYGGTLLSSQNAPFPICFAAGTFLDTADGLRDVQDLRIGDLLLTFDNGYQPIRWIGSRSISGSELEANPKLRPVTIQAGALGDNRPSIPLTLSPQHRVMLRSSQAIDLFGTDEILVPVKKLTELPGIDVSDLAEITYYHVLLDEHEILWSNGCLSESLYLGSQALQAITQEGRDEIAAIFPGIADGNFQAAPARPFAERKKHIRHILTG
ncbi:Hint domain-containing protein [Paracoccus saliphilus]|uniref:Hint domain-containing protein n=1 Tax=Paracoccus saliphilus TaxID=405559 RepID=A0AA45W3W8_9RHOB|nr:Hint domain-containing protein [Paracoccus saliphilus]WCR04262.1 Hint domain-containing protein [Paracoccus saliphilus]SIS80354.1 Hint domain-containing protein [Paracoccus saliphilus]